MTCPTSQQWAFCVKLVASVQFQARVMGINTEVGVVGWTSVFSLPLGTQLAAPAAARRAA